MRLQRGAFPADNLEPGLRSRWAVLVDGHLSVIEDQATVERLGRLVDPWLHEPRPYALLLVSGLSGTQPGDVPPDTSDPVNVTSPIRMPSTPALVTMPVGEAFMDGDQAATPPPQGRRAERAPSSAARRKAGLRRSHRVPWDRRRRDGRPGPGRPAALVRCSTPAGACGDGRRERRPSRPRESAVRPTVVFGRIGGIPVGAHWSVLAGVGLHRPSDAAGLQGHRTSWQVR